MDGIIALALTFIMIVIGYGYGSLDQSSHYRSIKQREARYRGILVFNEKFPPPEVAGEQFALVCGSIVMGADYFRFFTAALKTIFGGRLTSFETTLDRGRREAILRMKAEAHRMGAKFIFNVRFETCCLPDRRALPCVELMVYGTAWCASSGAKSYAT